MGRFLIYTLGFTLLLFVQEFILSSINMYSLVHIFLYVMVLVFLPLSIKRAQLLLLGFAVGYLADLIFGGGGLNAVCCVWLAFVRPMVVNYTLGRDSTTFGVAPTALRFGLWKFIAYLFTICLMFAAPYFLLEMMTLTNILYTSLRILSSTIVTAALMFVLHLSFSLYKE